MFMVIERLSDMGSKISFVMECSHACGSMVTNPEHSGLCCLTRSTEGLHPAAPQPFMLETSIARSAHECACLLKSKTSKRLNGYQICH